MNRALRAALVNPWLASLVSFLPIVAFLGVHFACVPSPLPTVAALSSMPLSGTASKVGRAVTERVIQSRAAVVGTLDTRFRGR